MHTMQAAHHQAKVRLMMCRMKARTSDADASAAKMASQLEDKAAEIRVLMQQQQRAQEEVKICQVGPSMQHCILAPSCLWILHLRHALWTHALDRILTRVQEVGLRRYFLRVISQTWKLLDGPSCLLNWSQGMGFSLVCHSDNASYRVLILHQSILS